MPDLDDILLMVGVVAVSLGAGLVLGDLVSVVVGVGGALLVSGSLALAAGVVLGRNASKPTGRPE